MRTPPTTTGLLVLLASLAASSVTAHADAIQLFSPDQLGSDAVTVFHTDTVDLLPSPHVVSTSDNVLTFILAAGEWRRLDEGVNVVSDFLLGTHLLYTNNNNGLDLNGQGSIGGGGSGPRGRRPCRGRAGRCGKDGEPQSRFLAGGHVGHRGPRQSRCGVCAHPAQRRLHGRRDAGAPLESILVR